MNCCHVQIIHRVIVFSSVDPPDDRECCFRMMNCGWRHFVVCVTILSFQLLDLPDRVGFPRSCFIKATGFPVTSSSLPVSDSERSTSLDSSFVATSFSVAVYINRQGMHLSVELENSTLRRILTFFSSCFQVSP